MAQGYLREWSMSALPALGIGVLMVALGYGMMPTDSVSANTPSATPAVVSSVPVSADAPAIEHVSLQEPRP
jgi:hypothetical protein